MSAIRPIPSLQYRQDQIEQNRENRGRLATVFAQFTTTGQGSVEVDERIDFNLTFVEMPFFADGGVCDADAIRDALDLTDSDPVDYPLRSAHVTDWDTDEKGNYTGASVALTVQYTGETDPSAQVTVEHHLQFSAVGLKDIDES